MAYGIPYKGSKNAIAKKIIDAMPEADTFIDLFAGGCAVAHCALLSGKYKRVIINDINPMPTQCFMDAIQGKFKSETRWISREDFFRLKDTDAYVRWCFSFGYDGRTYAYGRNTEPFKRAYHNAVFFGETEGLETIFEENMTEMQRLATREARYEWYKYTFLPKMVEKGKCEYIKRGSHYGMQTLKSLESLQSLERLQRLQSLERLQRLQSLERLQRLQSLQSLERLHQDYREVRCVDDKDTVVYCDIPYNNTGEQYGQDFDNEAFYDWARDRNNVYISEYNAPDDFEIVAEWERADHMSAKKTNKVTERLFKNKNFEG